MSTFNYSQSIPLGGKEATWALIAAPAIAPAVAGVAGGCSNCWKPSLSASLVMPLTPSARLVSCRKKIVHSAKTFIGYACVFL
jgi:hypothetical protein